VITLRAAASTASHGVPGLTAANAAACAFFSRFQISVWRAERRPKTTGARDVGLIAVDRAAAVDLDHVAFLQLLRLDAAVRERGERAEADPGAAAGRAEQAMRGGDVGLQIACVMPSLNVWKRRGTLRS
jgi:hypothetical protein